MARTTILLLIASSALAYSPAPRIDPCAGDATGNARFDELAVGLARKTFPGAELKRSCAIVRGAASVSFDRVEVTRNGVTFRMPVRVVFSRAVSVFEKPTTNVVDWRLETPVPLATLGKYADLIKQETLTARALKGTPVCLVDGEEKAVGFLCGPSSRDPDAFTPSMGGVARDQVTLEFLAHEPKAGSRCPAFTLENFTIPLSLATPRTPGWCLRRKEGGVAQLEKAANGVGWLQVVRTSRWEVSVIAKGQVVSETVAESDAANCEAIPPCN
jgi:hypothetical protein